MLTAMLRRRSTCWRMTCRNSLCSSGLRSPSSMSSSEPASENSGVLNSCDALAMRSRRARSRRACAVTSRSTTMEVKSASPPTGYVVASRVTSSCPKTTMSKSASSCESRQSCATSAGRASSTVSPISAWRSSRMAAAGLAMVMVPVRGQAEDAFAQVVEQHLDAVALVLDLGEGAPQPLGHHVEGVGQLADLVLDRLGHLGREVAAGDELGAPLDPLQPAGDEVRGQVAQDETDAQRQQRGEQQLALHRGDGVVHVFQ